jgi:hypothetical protein
MSIFYVLICIVSLALQSLVSLNIHNWCQDIHLISPIYFMHGGEWHVEPDREIDVDAVMSNRIEFDVRRDILEGALVYRVQRQHIEPAQDKSKHIWLLVAWNGKHTKGLHVRAFLVEHNKQLDEDRLKKLYQKRRPLLKTQTNTTKSNWTLNDATVLKAAIKVTNGGYRWDIFVSKRT